MKKILSTYALLFIVCTLFSQNNSLPNWIPTDGLYGYWPLDGNIYDLSGNENHGTTDGQYSTETYENGNQSVYLQNQMIILPTNSDLNIDNFTVQFWTKAVSYNIHKIKLTILPIFHNHGWQKEYQERISKWHRFLWYRCIKIYVCLTC